MFITPSGIEYSPDNPSGYRIIVVFDLLNKTPFILQQFVLFSVTFKLYDAKGNFLESIFTGFLNNGTTKINWSSNNYSTGTYIYKIQAGNLSASDKLLIIK